MMESFSKSWNLKFRFPEMDVEPKIVGFPPKSSILGFSIIFTIYFGGFPPIFGNTHMNFRGFLWWFLWPFRVASFAKWPGWIGSWISHPFCWRVFQLQAHDDWFSWDGNGIHLPLYTFTYKNQAFMKVNIPIPSKRTVYSWKSVLEFQALNLVSGRETVSFRKGTHTFILWKKNNNLFRFIGQFFFRPGRLQLSGHLGVSWWFEPWPIDPGCLV